jgi:hypothetical protein
VVNLVVEVMEVQLEGLAGDLWVENLPEVVVSHMVVGQVVVRAKDMPVLHRVSDEKISSLETDGQKLRHLL